MNQINALVDLNVSRLSTPLKTWHARVGHNFVARLQSVPDDISKVFVRVFKTYNAYYDVTAIEHRDGNYSVRIPASCFCFAGEYKYEVHATSSDDQPCALGEGKLVVKGFSTTTNPEKPGAVQRVAELPCEGGGFVQVVMKWDGYAWMPEAVYNATTTTEVKE